MWKTLTHTIAERMKRTGLNAAEMPSTSAAWSRGEKSEPSVSFSQCSGVGWDGGRCGAKRLFNKVDVWANLGRFVKLSSAADMVDAGQYTAEVHIA